MPARALLVLLVMLNLGVATWWALRPATSPPPRWAQPTGVPRLQLLAERADAAGVTPATPESLGDGPVAAAPTTPREAGAGPSVPGSALRCLAFGPFDDAAGVAKARAALQPLGASHMRVRDEVDAPRGWRVMLPAQSNRAAADALAAQIRGAGFSDLLVVPSGEEANAIALGLYGSEPAARRRESALRNAGFPVQALPVGDAVTRHWLDLAAGPVFDASAARTAASAARVQDVDCAGIVNGRGAR